ncbi:hypothetical protein SUDANB121_05451 [Nocardiopsis dassonvillei]|uniref:hypothetical protein n=1 Tax=Nocardiopsis dassonvillei TaxID=2014 RepID=UPI003F574ABC
MGGRKRRGVRRRAEHGRTGRGGAAEPKAPEEGRARPPRIGSPARRLGLAAVSALLAYFFLSVGLQFGGHEVRSLGAAYGWAGEAGRVTVTHEAQVRKERRCYGVFDPVDGPLREGVRVYSSHGCTPGRVADARLVDGERTRVSTSLEDRAYEEGAPGGVVGSVLLLVVIGLLCFGLGGLFGLGALVVGGGLAAGAARRLLRGQSN